MCYPKFQATHTSSYKKNKQIGTISPSGTKRGDCLISQYLQNHVTFEGVTGRHPKKNRGHFKKIDCFSQFFLLKSHHCLHTNLTQNNCHLIRKQKKHHHLSTIEFWAQKLCYIDSLKSRGFQESCFSSCTVLSLLSVQGPRDMFSFYVDSNKSCALSA